MNLKNESELLEAYTNAQLRAISEYSGDMRGDALELHDKVNAYAKEHGLPVPDVDWEIYTGYNELSS